MGKLYLILVLILISVIGLSACRASEPPSPTGDAATLALESSAFAPGEAIPVRFTCDGDDLSPPLAWAEPPPGTESLALIFDDPDAPAGTWVHWVLFSIPATARSLPEGAAGTGLQGTNSWGRDGYGGPCPPSGSTHTYVFRLYALDATLDLAPGASKEALLDAVQGHVLAEGQLTGTYARQ